MTSRASGVLAYGTRQPAQERQSHKFHVMAAAEVLVVLFLGAVVLGQVARVPLIANEIKSAPLLLSDLLAGALCLWLFASVLTAGRMHLDRAVVLLGGFVAVNALAISVAAVRFDMSVPDVVFSSLYLIRWTLYATLYVVALTVVRRSAAPRLIRATLIACGIFAAFGIFQSAFLPDFAFIVYPDAVPYVDWDLQGNRLVSTFLDPNYAGTFIMFGLLFVHARGAELRKPSYPLLALFWVALFLTLSRSSIIAAFFGVVLLAYRTRSFRKLFVPLLCFVLVGTLAADRLIQFATTYNKLTLMEASALSRLADWLLAWRIFIDNPLIGVGYNTFGIVRAAYGSPAYGAPAFGSDGGVLYLAAVSGIAGVALFGGVLWRLTMVGWGTYQTRTLPQNVRALGLTLHVWIPSLLLQSFASNSIVYPFIIGLLFLMGGLCARQYYEATA